MTFNLTANLVLLLSGIPQSLSFCLLYSGLSVLTYPLFSFTFRAVEKYVCAILVDFPSHNSLLTKWHKHRHSTKNLHSLATVVSLISKRHRLSKMMIWSVSPQRVCQVLVHMATERAVMISVDITWKWKSKAQIPLYRAACFAGIHLHLSWWLWNAAMLWKPLVHASQF